MYFLFFLYFPFVWVMPVIRHFCTATFCYFFSSPPPPGVSFTRPLVFFVSLHAILPSQMRSSSFVQPPCFVVSDLFGDLSSFILTMCPVQFIRLSTIFQTIPALIPTYSLKSVVPFPSRACSLALLRINPEPSI